MSVGNLLTTWAERSAYDISVGTAWYPYARLQCQVLATEFGLELEPVVYATAALSPLLKWERNIQATRALLTGRKPGAVFKSNVDKARRCLAGDLGALSGQKVQSFAANIMGDHNRVTVDTWAWRIWAGVRDGARTLTPVLYATIEHDYKVAADAAGLTPAAFQAVTWTTIRRLVNGRAAPGQMTLL